MASYVTVSLIYNSSLNYEWKYKMRLCLQRMETYFISVRDSNDACTLYIFIKDVTAVKETKIT